MLRQIQPLPTLDSLHLPPALLARLGKEILILLETPPPTLGTIHPGPPTGKRVREREHQEQPVLEIVEADGRQQRDGEIGKAPDDDGDGGALGARAGGVDLGGDEPGWDEPADAEGGGGEEEDYHAGDAGGEGGDVQLGVVRSEAA